MRKITIINSKSQTQHVINDSNAVTLEELKQEMVANGISSEDIQDTVFFEGKSRTELKDDASVLPTNVMYKGAVTNDLVFMMTSNNTKIKSGMVNENTPRKTLYNIIKEYDIKDDIKECFDANYTHISNKDLCDFINEYENHHCTCCNCPNVEVLAIDAKNVEELRKKVHAIVEYVISSIFNKEEVEGVENKAEEISPAEIKNMFDFLGK